MLGVERLCRSDSSVGMDLRVSEDGAVSGMDEVGSCSAGLSLNC